MSAIPVTQPVPIPEGAAPPGGAAASADELRELLRVFSAVRDGDFTVRLPGHWTGLVGKIADAVNEVVASNQSMASQLERVGQVVGQEGKTKQRVRFPRQGGSWADMEVSLNTLIDDLLWP